MIHPRDDPQECLSSANAQRKYGNNAVAVDIISRKVKAPRSPSVAFNNMSTDPIDAPTTSAAAGAPPGRCRAKNCGAIPSWAMPNARWPMTNRAASNAPAVETKAPTATIVKPTRPSDRVASTKGASEFIRIFCGTSTIVASVMSTYILMTVKTPRETARGSVL